MIKYELRFDVPDYGNHFLDELWIGLIYYATNIREAGFELVMTEDVTDNEVEVSQR